MAIMVDIANAASAGVARPIQFFHMPVPKARTDDAYFAPLANLRLHPETQLYLGLIHHDDVAGDAARSLPRDATQKSMVWPQNAAWREVTRRGCRRCSRLMCTRRKLRLRYSGGVFPACIAVSRPAACVESRCAAPHPPP
jgi:hypothetical protein